MASTIRLTAPIFALLLFGCGSRSETPATSIATDTAGDERTSTEDVVVIAPAALFNPHRELMRLGADGALSSPDGISGVRLHPDGSVSSPTGERFRLEANGDVLVHGEAMVRIEGDQLLGEDGPIVRYVPGWLEAEGGALGDRIRVEGNAPPRTVLLLYFCIMQGVTSDS